MIAHSGPISGISVDFANRVVASAGYDNRVILWDLDSREPRQQFFHDHLANFCAFSPDGKLLATASSDYTARIWDIERLMLSAVITSHTDDVDSVAFHPTSPLLLTTSHDNTIRVSSFSGDLLLTLDGHEIDTSACWNVTGDKIISCGDDGFLKIRSAVTGSIEKAIDVGAQATGLVVTAQDRVIVGSDVGQLLMFDGNSCTSVEAHPAAIKTLAYDGRTNMIITSAYDQTYGLWEIKDSTEIRKLRSIELPDIVWPRAVAIGEQKIIAATFGSTFASYEIESDEWDTRGVVASSAINVVKEISGTVFSVGDSGKIYADGQLVGDVKSLCNFVTDFSGTIICGGQMGHLYDGRSGRSIFKNSSPLNCAISFERHGAHVLLVGTYTGELLEFASYEDQLIFERKHRIHDNAIKSLATDGQVFLSACATGEVALRRCDDFTMVFDEKRGHDTIANGSTCLKPSLFGTVGRDLTLRLWNSSGLERIVRTPHSHSVRAVAADMTGSVVATGAYDGTTAQYNVDFDKWSPLVRRTSAGISSIAFSTRRKSFQFASYDGKIYEEAVCA